MGRPKINLEKNKKHFTKKEIAEKEEVENRIKEISRELKAPSWLNKKGVDIFNETVDLLNAIKVLDDLDIPILATYSDAYANIQELSEIIRKEGYTIDLPVGTNYKTVVNPNVNTLKQYQKLLLDTAKQLGINSIDRTKLIKLEPKKEEKDEFEGFL